MLQEKKAQPKDSPGTRRLPYVPPKATFVPRNQEERLFTKASESSMACA